MKKNDIINLLSGVPENADIMIHHRGVLFNISRIDTRENNGGFIVSFETMAARAAGVPQIDPADPAEIWRPVNGFRGYEVSNLGRVRSNHTNCHKSGKILPYWIDAYGYCTVMFGTRGNTARKRVHRLVADAFIDNPNNYKLVNHIDENKQNNRADNLEWCSYHHNANHGTRNNRIGAAHQRQVEQYDIHGNLLATHNSIQDAADAVGLHRENISACCNGRRPTARGYIWRFRE